MIIAQALRAWTIEAGSVGDCVVTRFLAMTSALAELAMTLALRE